MRKIKDQLKKAFSDLDSEVVINIFGFGEDMIEMDIVSDKWEGIPVFQRIQTALKTIEDRTPDIYNKFCFCACPVTMAEFSERVEDRKHG